MYQNVKRKESLRKVHKNCAIATEKMTQMTLITKQFVAINIFIIFLQCSDLQGTEGLPSHIQMFSDFV